jgi:hypothetical protein
VKEQTPRDGAAVATSYPLNGTKTVVATWSMTLNQMDKLKQFLTGDAKKPLVYAAGYAAYEVSNGG